MSEYWRNLWKTTLKRLVVFGWFKLVGQEIVGMVVLASGDCDSDDVHACFA